MTNSTQHAQAIWLGAGTADATLHSLQLDEADLTSPYSVALRVLVNACLEFDPAKRPEAAVLREAVRRHTGRDEGGEWEDLARGMREGVGGGEDVVLMRGDRYQVGLARGRLPREGLLHGR